MIREFIIGESMLSIQQRFRRDNKRLIRVIPRSLPGQGNVEAYVVLYVMAIG